jgi:hypothetical protein
MVDAFRDVHETSSSEGLVDHTTMNSNMCALNRQRVLPFIMSFMQTELQMYQAERDPARKKLRNITLVPWYGHDSICAFTNIEIDLCSIHFMYIPWLDGTRFQASKNSSKEQGRHAT